MSDSTVLIAVLSVLGSVIAIVASVVGVMIWIVKRMDKRQDTTIDKNTNAIEKSNDAFLTLAQSINNSSAASRSLEESIKKRDEQDREFQKHVIESFTSQSKLLRSIVEKADRNHDAIVKKQTVKVQNVEHQTVVETLS
jgi:hypothetical protein